ncbi:MAG: signal peptidase II [Thermoanaerobaculia bacterium]|nr:signal peptidase II [Thermoanaerobaculia bacterium]
MTPPESAARPRRPPFARRPAKASYLLLSLVVLLLDQLSKGLIEARLPLFGRYEVVPGFLNLVHVRNRGVAFGLLSEHGSASWGVLLLVVLGLGALTVVAIYFRRTPPTERLLLVSLALIMGGAVGNLVDRIGSGAVTDFVDAYYGTYHWHTFNVADSAITIGIVLMLIDFVFAGGRTAEGDAPTGGERSVDSPSDSAAD